MTTTSKPREYDLYFEDEDNHSAFFENYKQWTPDCGEPEPDVHVIEYSSYEEMQLRCAEYRDSFQKELARCEQLEKKNAKLVKAMEALKEFLGELTIGPSPDAPTIVEVYIEPVLIENGEQK